MMDTCLLSGIHVINIIGIFDKTGRTFRNPGTTGDTGDDRHRAVKRFPAMWSTKSSIVSGR